MKRLFPALIASLLLVGAGCLSLSDGLTPQPQPAIEPVVGLFGAVEAYDSATRIITLVSPDGGADEVFVVPGTNVPEEVVGRLVTVSGERDLTTRRVTATGLQLNDLPNLVVTSPLLGSIVTSPLVVFGFGRTFEQSFAYRIRDAANKVVFEGHALTAASGMGMYGPFRTDIILPAMAEKGFSLEVFQFSAKDGTVIDLVTVPLTLLTTDTTVFDVFFPNRLKGSNADCSLTFPVSRTVAKTAAVGRAAIASLLSGPTTSERAQGSFTSINAGTQLRSLSINDGTAVADFNAYLNAAGSCRVTAIRSQVENTLRQFDAVSDVVISVEGKADTALQP
ncbi:hypothetical protein EPO34_03800 [Patescibacteria group bacterium]|nr:MAG: hypothetical protein EPO34_03800 [Patescibacteria group bacterium]